MKRVAVLGLGLIGGSLGLAVGRRYDVVGYDRRSDRRRTALRRGAARTVTASVREAVETADIVILAVPVRAMPALAREAVRYMRRGAVLTDVGSVKAAVEKSVGPLARTAGVAFVGGHPLAGSEKSGVENASATLFRKSVCVLTRRFAHAKAVAAVSALWRAAGGTPRIMDAARHDRALALTSHLPHVIAFALVARARAEGRAIPGLQGLAAGSFRDATRVAASDPELWAGIFRENRAEILRQVRLFCASLSLFPLMSERQLTALLKARS